MGIRMTGIISGLDTDSIVKELMSAHSLKKTKIENKLTKHEWKQDKWKELNTKIYALYTGNLSKLRSQGTYLSKKASSSNEAKVSVKASKDAVEGSHTIKVEQMAKSQYLTGEKLSATDAEGKAVNTSTKLIDLGMASGTTINIATDDKSYSLDVTESTNLNDFLNACKQAGLNATYDTTQGRLFVSSSSSGVANAFSITTNSSSAAGEKNAIRDAIGYSDQTGAEKIKIDKALLTYAASDDDEAVDSAYELLLGKVIDKTTAEYSKSILASYKDGDLEASDSATFDYLKNAADTALNKYLDGLKDPSAATQEEKDKVIDKALTAAATECAKQKKEEYQSTGWVAGENPYADAVSGFNILLSDYVTAIAGETVTDLGGAGLEKLGLTEVTYTREDGKLKYETNGSASIALVEASNSIVEYNGAKLEGASNTITANGLTFTVQDITAANETITLTVSKDTDEVYKSIKSFITEYNTLLDEMNTLYNAGSAKGYEPLTDDERGAMTDDQIEKWEKKIKDSLLRRDSTLSSLVSTLKESLMGSVQYNGKSYSLSSFGISTKYYTEKGKLHIAGDSEDPLTSDDKDKLMAALQNDPEAVMNVLSKLGQKLYDDVSNKMKSSSLSSAMTVYNDKQMKKELTNYQDQLKKMETKLKDLEDRYYKQFTAMEKAMSNLTSQSNSLSSLMGMNTGK